LSPSETQVDEAVPDLARLADPGDVVRLGGPVGPGTVIAESALDLLAKLREQLDH
jgi:tetrahydrodipicolinate N-succinyltransferase